MRRFDNFPEGFDPPLLYGGAYKRASELFVEYRGVTETALRERFGRKFGKMAYIGFRDNTQPLTLSGFESNRASVRAVYNDSLAGDAGPSDVIMVTMRLFQDDMPYMLPSDREDINYSNLYSLCVAPEMPPVVIHASRLEYEMLPEEWMTMPKHFITEGDCEGILQIMTGRQPETILRDPGHLEIAA